MTHRALVAIGCVLLSVASIGAQARGAAADPISGTWEGALNVPMAPEPVAVTFELKFDGKSNVSGTFVGLPNPGEVKAGTFDARTGALKLELGKTGSSGVLIILEGSVTKGVATGRVTGEGGDGDFKIAKKAA